MDRCPFCGCGIFRRRRSQSFGVYGFLRRDITRSILLIVLGVASFATGRDAAEIAISAQLTGLLGPQGSDLLKTTVENASGHKGFMASVVAVVTLLVGASGVFGEMQSTLNLMWKVPPRRTSLLSLARTRAASLGLVASLGFLLLVSLAASAAVSALGGMMTSRLPFGEFLLSVANTLVSLVLVALLFGAIFKILPDRALSWRDVRFGAAVTAILFTVGKSLIGWYLGTSAIASSYGAAGSLIVLLLWVFYSSRDIPVRCRDHARCRRPVQKPSRFDAHCDGKNIFGHFRHEGLGCAPARCHRVDCRNFINCNFGLPPSASATLKRLTWGRPDRGWNMSRSTNCPDIRRANPLMAMAPRSQRVSAPMRRACLGIRLLRV
ncbi:YihY/virulence factor BrkB family protein (plasmid) [Mesorhizobium terrae]